jgi:hypothetical protein
MILERYGFFPLHLKSFVSTMLSATIIQLMITLGLRDYGRKVKMNRRACKQKGRAHVDSAFDTHSFPENFW